MYVSRNHVKSVILWALSGLHLVSKAVTRDLLIATSEDFKNAEETELLNQLFSDYHEFHRPLGNIRIRASLNLLSLNYLSWTDRRLIWAFSNVTYVYATDKFVWVPALIIENSVDNMDVIKRPSVPIRINHYGMITWLPAGIFITHCESYVTYWPLDTQKCDIILSSWAYTNSEVSLVFMYPKMSIITTFYQEHGEWELLNTKQKPVRIKRERQYYSRLVFTLTFRRRPLFHILNTLFPVALMGFLTVAIFKLNPESGERVSLALTILLAYAVYLSLISESIPQTSMSASLLSSYLAGILFLQTLSVLLTVIYLDMYFTKVDKPVPRWLITFTKRLMRGSCCKKRKTTQQCKDSVEDPDDCTKSSQYPCGNTDASSKTPIEAWNDNINNDVEEDQPSWKDVALILDKVTMYIYLALVTSLTLVCWAVMLIHYLNAYTKL